MSLFDKLKDKYSKVKEQRKLSTSTWAYEERLKALKAERKRYELRDKVKAEQAKVKELRYKPYTDAFKNIKKKTKKLKTKNKGLNLGGREDMKTRW